MMRPAVLFALAGMLSACSAAPQAQSGARPAVALSQPTDPLTMEEQRTLLLWDRSLRRERFAAMEDHYVGLVAQPAGEVRDLQPGAPLDPSLSARIDSYMEGTGAVGALVIQNAQVRYRRVAPDIAADARWTSFSVAKSFTSTLLGAALADGSIASLDDPVTRYLPGLVGSAYDDVTVEQLATMTSGVAWNEDYSDITSDVVQSLLVEPVPGEPQTVTYMKKLDRADPPGERWVYKTGETNLLGTLVEGATGEPLAAYAKRKIVDPAGFAGPLFWMLDPSGDNIGGCCISLALDDYGRFGQFVLEGGKGSVAPGWFAQAGAAQVAFSPTSGYGYQWWNDGAGYSARGIFGQSIAILPEHDAVVVILSNWPGPSSGDLVRARSELVAAIAEGLD